MDFVTFLIQILNGVQYGFTLFLVASGLTLIFGIMGIINLAHGAFYMVGAYLTYWLVSQTGNLAVAIALGLPIMLVFGYLIERLAISFLYKRDHLYQVLLTYGLILILNEMQKILWGSEFYSVPVPDILSASIPHGQPGLSGLPVVCDCGLHGRGGGYVCGDRQDQTGDDDPGRGDRPGNDPGDGY